MNILNGVSLDAEPGLDSSRFRAGKTHGGGLHATPIWAVWGEVAMIKPELGGEFEEPKGPRGPISPFARPERS